MDFWPHTVWGWTSLSLAFMASVRCLTILLQTRMMEQNMEAIEERFHQQLEDDEAREWCIRMIAHLIVQGRLGPPTHGKTPIEIIDKVIDRRMGGAWHSRSKFPRSTST